MSDEKPLGDALSDIGDDLDAENLQQALDVVRGKDVTHNEELRALIEQMYEAEKRAPNEEAKHLLKWRNELEAVIDDE